MRRIAAVVEPSLAPRVPKPIRVKRSRFLKENELERYVDLAARQAGSDGRILIILDADDDCPARRVSEILDRATTAAGHRELASATTAPADPESVRDAKGWLLTHAAGAGIQRNS